MNCSVYIFGKLGDNYTQYPTDYTQEYFQDFNKRAKATSQLGVRREGDLMFYQYIRRLSRGGSSDSFIGLAIVLNGILITDFSALFKLFEDAITNLVVNGEILEFADDGTIISKVSQLYKVSNEFKRVTEYLSLQVDKTIQRTEKLPPENYSISKNHIKELSYTDEQQTLIDATKNFSKVVVYKDDNYESSTLSTYASKLNAQHKQNVALQKTIEENKETISKLKRQKKQTTVVAILSVVMAIVLIWFLSFANDKNATIRQQNSEISSLNKHVSSLKNDSSYLEQTLYETKLELKSKKEELKTANEEKTRFEKRDKENQRLITAQKQTIARLEQTKSEQASMISNLQNRLNGTTYSSNTNSSSTSSQRYTSSSSKSVGASTYKMGQNFDATYCLWLYARKSIKINSFYVKADKIGYITIGLYNANTRLEASEKFYIGQAKTAVRLNPSNFKITKSGYYYLAIVQSNGMGLCYHSSNANEYASWQSGNLQVTGANTKGKTSYDDKNKRSYYQYFYSIEYTDY